MRILSVLEPMSITAATLKSFFLFMGMPPGYGNLFKWQKTALAAADGQGTAGISMSAACAFKRLLP
jgi:hypothetical protein